MFSAFVSFVTGYNQNQLRVKWDKNIIGKKFSFTNGTDSSRLLPLPNQNLFQQSAEISTSVLAVVSLENFIPFRLERGNLCIRSEKLGVCESLELEILNSHRSRLSWCEFTDGYELRKKRRGAFGHTQLKKRLANSLGEGIDSGSVRWYVMQCCVSREFFLDFEYLYRIFLDHIPSRRQNRVTLHTSQLKQKLLPNFLSLKNLLAS